jgi:hypothetical protein
MLADDARHALQRVDSSAADHGVDLFAVEFVAPYEGYTWDDPAEELHYTTLAQQAEESSEIIFDEPYVYEHDDE